MLARRDGFTEATGRFAVRSAISLRERRAVFTASESGKGFKKIGFDQYDIATVLNEIEEAPSGRFAEVEFPIKFGPFSFLHILFSRLPSLDGH